MKKDCLDEYKNTERILRQHFNDLNIIPESDVGEAFRTVFTLLENKIWEIEFLRTF